MAKITYIHSDSTQEQVETAEDQSIMRAAILNDVKGIVGECGGQAMCATCHVYVEDIDGELPEISEDEEEMLEYTADEQLQNSRLGCQLKGDLHFSEITVRIPVNQV